MKAVGVFFLLGIINLAWANQPLMDGKVMEVLSGDQLVVDMGAEGKMTLRLSTVDSPELDQEFGEDAKKFTEKLILKKKISLQLKGQNREGEETAIVYFKDEIINEMLVKEGLAWVIRSGLSLPPGAEAFIDAETKAKEAKRGLWQAQGPIAPWVFRRRSNMREAKYS